VRIEVLAQGGHDAEMLVEEITVLTDRDLAGYAQSNGLSPI